MNNNSITIWIAIYAAILSTIVFLWNLFRDLTDRGKLEVYCYIGNLITKTGPMDDKSYLVYSVTNRGRRPIMVLHVGGEFKKKSFVVNPGNLPKMLQPGEYLLEWSHDLSILDENLVCLWALDSLGKKHKVKKKVLRDLITKQGSKKLKEAKDN